MAERYKSIFFAILSLALVWLIIILFFLPQEDDHLEQWATISPQRISSEFPEIKVNYAHIRDGPKLRRRSHQSTDQLPKPLEFINQFRGSLGREELLFYQFDTHNKQSDANTTISKDLHDKKTRKLGLTVEQTDQQVKTEGFKLFAFNLLVSNRVGLIRALPDTRHEKCSNTQITSHAVVSANITGHNTSTYTHPLNHLQASIIICYYNEAPSALLRTVFSVIERSPKTLLREIIVVDDFSSEDFSESKIRPFISSDLVNYVRTTKREGLIRARLLGANMAKGDVLIFLDSHVEANVGWLEPLLQVINENRTTIACPMIDLINAETLIYSASPMVKGGLNWALNFKWDSVPSEKLKTYDDFIKPIESPTMAGGLFAIERDFFNQIGTYDRGMDLWGGENVELSLRAWMCGGQILILPCSRLGHIFRKRRPYGPEPNKPDSLLVNSHRAARVWLDEHIDKFYEANPGARYLISGEISQRLDLKHKLGCHNFSWFLDNIYPSLRSQHIDANRNVVESSAKPRLFKFDSESRRIDRSANRRHGRELNVLEHLQQQHQIPTYRGPSGRISLLDNDFGQPGSFVNGDRNLNSQNSGQVPKTVSRFQIKSADSNLCIESRGGFMVKSFTRLVLNSCAEVRLDKNGDISANDSSIMNQLWTETELHDYRLGDNQCLDLIKYLPLLRKCHNMGSFQSWKRDATNSTATSITNSGGGLCLSVERVQIGEPIIVTICDRKIVERNELEESFKNDPEQLHHTRHADRLGLAGWRTGSSFLHSSSKLKKTFGLKPLRPCQSWNLIYTTDNNTATGYDRKDPISHSYYIKTFKIESLL